MLNRSSKNLATEQEAYDYALDILSYRDYSRKDMELKLKRKGADAGIIKSTIQKLLEYGSITPEVADFLQMKNVMDRGFLKPGFLKNTMADVTCGWSCRKKMWPNVI